MGFFRFVFIILYGHDFASRLVMKGFDLNTIREILGHSDIKITMRYAHMAPQKKRTKINMLD